MSFSSTTSLTIKQYLAKENNCKIALLIISCSTIGILVLFHGLKELYKIKTFIMGQCQVKSIDLKTEKDNVYPLWFITILHDNQKSEDIIIGSTGYRTRYEAWKAAHDYRVIKERFFP
ncbi:unnamed protein product [Rotaria sordida]|uniref:Uncharacterized protein n=1 Tax=Rotaria sordida TaxID=392033 RepID=A0A815WNV9_9BILA|nr:unnamed protein product [Rotaria sordida]